MRDEPTTLGAQPTKHRDDHHVRHSRRQFDPLEGSDRRQRELTPRVALLCHPTHLRLSGSVDSLAGRTIDQTEGAVRRRAWASVEHLGTAARFSLGRFTRCHGYSPPRQAARLFSGVTIWHAPSSCGNVSAASAPKCDGHAARAS